VFFWRSSIIGAQLLRCALALALLLGVFLGCGARFIELGAGDDFVVDAGDDFFDGLAGDDLSFFRLGRLLASGFFSGSGAAKPGFSSAGACGLSGCWEDDSWAASGKAAQNAASKIRLRITFLTTPV